MRRVREWVRSWRIRRCKLNQDWVELAISESTLATMQHGQELIFRRVEHNISSGRRVGSA
jgi:hypothetical protein